MTSSRATVRGATPEDLLACTDIWRSTVDRSLQPASEPYGLYGHELETGTLLVAEIDNQPTGFGASTMRDDRWFLADLFVSPEMHGRGIGGLLLDALIEFDQPGPVRATMASTNLRALTLYTKLGMAPQWPCLVVATDPAAIDLADPATDAPMVDVVDAAELLALASAAEYSLDQVDISYWQREVAVDLLVVRASDGTALGGAVVRWSTPFSVSDPTAISVGPLFAMQADNMGSVVAATLGIIGERSAGRIARLFVPGPNPVLPLLLDAGGMIADFDLFSATRRDIIDPLRVFPSHDLL